MDSRTVKWWGAVGRACLWAALLVLAGGLLPACAAGRPPPEESGPTPTQAAASGPGASIGPDAAEKTAAPTAGPTPAPSTSPAPAPTKTPGATPTATRTPRPSPTLPAGEDFACLPEDGARVSGVVAGVVDGDTIRVQVGFQSFTVRYIGIDTPETSVTPAEFMGIEARSRNRELVSGERVTLVSDPEVGDTDIYNRLLRYVIVDDVFVNVELVREGLARYFAGEMACGELIFAAEFEARAERVGIWSDP